MKHNKLHCTRFKTKDQNTELHHMINHDLAHLIWENFNICFIHKNFILDGNKSSLHLKCYFFLHMLLCLMRNVKRFTKLSHSETSDLLMTTRRVQVILEDSPRIPAASCNLGCKTNVIRMESVFSLRLFTLFQFQNVSSKYL